jgi:A/G-specific adenine glycosylase
VIAISQPQKNIDQNLSSSKINWFRTQLSAWGKQNLRDFPWRNTSNPYDIFIAEFLLQKTNADTVAPIYKIFLIEYPTIQDLERASVEDLENILKPLGLFFRAERLHQCAKILLEKYNGAIPSSEKQLLTFPGIGIYTARAICSQAFSQPLAVLDANVARILERFFNLQGEKVKSRCRILWGAAEKIAPDREVGKWNLTLLDFGALVCTARNPLCQDCPLSTKCNYAKDVRSHF